MTAAPRWSGALWSLLPGVLLIGASLLVFSDTAAAMVAIWRRSDTFAHAFLVAPISLWLIWRRRAELAVLPRQAEPLALLVALGACLLWLLGELAAVRAATQFALVTLVVVAVPAVFGRHVAKAIAFPLLFLFFAVPIGEFMVPPMIRWTADFTVFALRATGIPVYREGMQFVIPSGNWSVVEACSGVRYLIASFMVGTLFAYLNFRSPGRRAAFMVLSLVVPIIANWVRAYLIVMIGHVSSNKLAAGVDHLVYGWVFFGAVTAAMFALGMRWAEPDPTRAARTSPEVPNAPAPGSAPARAGGAWLAGAAMLAMMAAANLYADRLMHGVPTAWPTPGVPAPAAGWVAEREAEPWQPDYRTARRTVQAAYMSGDRRVALWLGYYAGQDENHKLVTSGNRVTSGEEGSAWAQVATGLTAHVSPVGAAWRTATLRGSAVPGVQAKRLRVWHAYAIGGRLVVRDAEAALRIALRRLLGQGDEAFAVFLSTPLDDDTPAAVERADAALAAFVNDHARPLQATLQAQPSAGGMSTATPMAAST